MVLFSHSVSTPVTISATFELVSRCYFAFAFLIVILSVTCVRKSCIKYSLTQVFEFQKKRFRLFPGACPSKVPRTFSVPKGQLSNCNPLLFKNLIFLHVFNVRKTKRIAKFDGLEPRRREDIKGIVAPAIGRKTFGTFEKQAPGPDICISWKTEETL